MITLDKVSVEFSKILNEVKKKHPKRKQAKTAENHIIDNQRKINNFFILGNFSNVIFVEIKESTPKFFSVFFFSMNY